LRDQRAGTPASDRRHNGQKRDDALVTNTNDSGAGSLRQAILDANSIPGLDTVVFNIPGPGVKTIALGSDLPDVSNPLVIDGTTQPGFSGSAVIELVGTNGSNNNVLHLTAGASVVRGLVINRAGFAGIRMDGNGGNVVEGCFIGTDATGTSPLGNGAGGAAGNSIGGTEPGHASVRTGRDAEDFHRARHGRPLPSLLVLLQYPRIAGVPMEVLVDDKLDLPKRLPAKKAE